MNEVMRDWKEGRKGKERTEGKYLFLMAVVNIRGQKHIINRP